MMPAYQSFYKLGKHFLVGMVPVMVPIKGNQNIPKSLNSKKSEASSTTPKIFSKNRTEVGLAWSDVASSEGAQENVIAARWGCSCTCC
jgi:hypothetical protein